MSRSEILAAAKPILFNTEMAQAIQDNRKSMTRRVAKVNRAPVPTHWKYLPDMSNLIYAKFLDEAGEIQLVEKPYIAAGAISGKGGQILYMPEAWKAISHDHDTRKLLIVFRPDNKKVWIKLDAERWKKFIKYISKNSWQSPYFMPKEAARIFLHVTDVRVERLQEIGKDGYFAEGVDPDIWYKAFSYSADKRISDEKMKSEFTQVWNGTIKKSDHDKYSWAANPWVWVIQFERIVPTDAN